MKPKSNKVAYIVSMGKGLESFIYREIEHLMECGQELILFATKYKKHDIYSPKSNWEHYYFTTATFLLHLPLLLLQLPLRPKLLMHAIGHRGIPELLFALRYSSIMKSKGIEAIHCHFGDRKLFVGYYCKQITGLPLSVTIHSHELHVNPNDKLYRAAIHDCDKIFAISQLAVNILTNRDGLPNEKVHLSRLFVDTEQWNPTAPLRVLTVGRFEEQKGFQDLIAAAKILVDENIEFVIVGFGPLDVRQMVSQAGLDHKIVIFDKLGQSQLRLLFQQCDIYCLPSISHPTQGKEGIPVVIMEAMACGLPVIATDAGAVSEIVRDGLVPEKSPTELAEAIKKLATDPDARKQQGQENRKFVEAEYSENNLQNFHRLLNEVG